VVAEVARLRRQRYTGQQIAAGLRISPATVSHILRRLGLNAHSNAKRPLIPTDGGQDSN
jgi:DNA-binding CsgD family transcriptional regulator